MSIVIAPGTTLGALQRQPLLDPVDQRILVCHALGIARTTMITQSERALSVDEAQRIAQLLQRRANGEPVAYIVGSREFYGLPFATTPAVLIPRPDTELLVELALQRLPPRGRVLDLGTGSGAIAVAIAHSRPDADVTALDVSEAALQIAVRNAQRNGAQVRFLHSDWFAAVAGDKFDLIVSNPPYIADGDRHLAEGDLRFEPSGALTDFADGLSALRMLVLGAPAHAEPGAWLLMEHGYDQSEAVRRLLSSAGYTEVASWQDLAGIERVSGGRVPG
jgi:release factor glutamine methyltransferase